MTRRFIARFVSHQAKRSSLLSDEGIARYSYSFSANRLKNVGATSEAQRLASLRALSVRAVSSDVGGQAGVEKALLRPKYPAFLPSFLHTPVGTPATFNRYALIPAAITNHLSLGSIFAWSVFNQPLTTVDGVVAASAADWSLGDTSLTFSLVMGGFAWGGLFGNFLKHLGPRACGVIGATTLGTGYLMVYSFRLWNRCLSPTRNSLPFLQNKISSGGCRHPDPQPPVTLRCRTCMGHRQWFLVRASRSKFASMVS